MMYLSICLCFIDILSVVYFGDPFSSLDCKLLEKNGLCIPHITNPLNRKTFESKTNNAVFS